MSPEHISKSYSAGSDLNLTPSQRTPRQDLPPKRRVNAERGTSVAAQISAERLLLKCTQMNFVRRSVRS
jgi:hypothetical protein